MFKKSILIIILAIIAIPVGVISAQNTTGNYKFPRLYTTDFSLEQETALAGQEVRGSFTVHNTSDFNATDLSYVISLGSDYNEGGSPGVTFDPTAKINIPFLGAKSKKTFQFVYQMGEGYSGDLGLHIKIFNNANNLLSWADTRFSISGKSESKISAERASIVVKGAEFTTGSGPTIYDDDEFSFNAIFDFNKKEDLVLIPELNIHKGSTNDPIVKTVNFPQTELNNERKIFFLESFDISDLEPGVYVASLKLLDGKKNNHSIPVIYRFIKGGPIGKIHDVTSDSLSVERGESFDVNVVYSGVPVDIVNIGIDGYEFIANDLEADLNLIVKDAKTGDLIGKTTRKVELKGLQDVSLNFKAEKGSNQLAFFVEIVQDGKILDEYRLEMPEGEMVDSGEFKFVYEILIIGFVILLIIIALLLRKRKVNIPLAILTLSILGSGGIIFEDYINKALLVEAEEEHNVIYSVGGVHNDPGDNTYAPDNVSIQDPKPPSVKVYNPGEEFNFQAHYSAAMCNNAQQISAIYTSLKGDTWASGIPQSVYTPDPNRDLTNGLWWQDESWATTVKVTDNRDQYRAGGHSVVINEFPISAEGGYKVPNEPGVYRFHFYIYNRIFLTAEPKCIWSTDDRCRSRAEAESRSDVSCKKDCTGSDFEHAHGAYLGYQDVEVRAPDQCTNIDSSTEGFTEDHQDSVPEGYVRAGTECYRYCSGTAPCQTGACWDNKCYPELVSKCTFGEISHVGGSKTFGASNGVKVGPGDVLDFSDETSGGDGSSYDYNWTGDVNSPVNGKNTSYTALLSDVTDNDMESANSRVTSTGPTLEPNSAESSCTFEVVECTVNSHCPGNSSGEICNASTNKCEWPGLSNSCSISSNDSGLSGPSGGVWTLINPNGSDPVTWTFSPEGGAGNYSYNWSWASSNPADSYSGGSGASHNRTFTSNNVGFNYTATVNVSDGQNPPENAQSSCVLRVGNCNTTSDCSLSGEVCSANKICTLPPPVISTFSISPKIVNQGEKCTLSIVASGASTCSISGTTPLNYTDDPKNDGKIDKSGLVSGGTYTATCTNETNTGTAVAGPLQCIESGNKIEI